ALSLTGTTEAPHFDRIAFKVARIYATLAADRLTANLKFSPDEQEFKCMLAPDAFAPIPNAWGKQGWTTVTLATVKVAELRHAVSESKIEIEGEMSLEQKLDELRTFAMRSRRCSSTVRPRESGDPERQIEESEQVALGSRFRACEPNSVFAGQRCGVAELQG